MKNSEIIISNPCNKDWNKMTPNDNGKHCNSCNKTVIDFTTWEVEEIKTYLQNKNEHICGHFKTLQVAVKRPKHHQFLVDLYWKTDTNLKSPYLKTIMLSLIILCMAAIGCNRPNSTGKVSKPDDITTRTTGEIAMPIDKIDTLKSSDTLLGDTIVEIHRKKTEHRTTTGNVCLKPEKNK